MNHQLPLNSKDNAKYRLLIQIFWIILVLVIQFSFLYHFVMDNCIFDRTVVFVLIYVITNCFGAINRDSPTRKIALSHMWLTLSLWFCKKNCFQILTLVLKSKVFLYPSLRQLSDFASYYNLFGSMLNRSTTRHGDCCVKVSSQSNKMYHCFKVDTQKRREVCVYELVQQEAHFCCFHDFLAYNMGHANQ